MLLIAGNLLAGLLLLFVGGEALVRGAMASGRRLGMSAMVSGLTIVAFGTSTPELFVSVRAAMLGLGGLAVGNVVGSNICNIGLILGLALLIRPITLDSRQFRKDIFVMIGAAAILLLILLDSRLSRTEGICLLACIVIYVAFTLRGVRLVRETPLRESPEPPKTPGVKLSISVAMIFLGLGLLVLGGNRFVHGAIDLAEVFRVAPAIIGLSVTAIGTSLPELAASTVAAVRGHSDLAIGNVVGSNIFNTFSVLGTTAVVQPTSAGEVSQANLIVMLLASLWFLRFVLSRSRLSRAEGLLLLVGFSVYIAWLLG